jgi:hypothetical protein
LDYIISRLVPTAVKIAEMPLILTHGQITTVQQVVKWVEPVSKKKRLIGLLKSSSDLERRTINVHINSSALLEPYQTRLFKVNIQSALSRLVLNCDHRSALM